MSLLPEFIFQTIITRGLRSFGTDSKLIDQLFRNLDQESSSQMRRFMTEKAVDVRINYPRDSLKIPSIIILLKSEIEDTAYLADSMGVGNAPNIFDFDGGISEAPIEVLGGVASTSTMSGLGNIILEPSLAVSGTNNTIKIGSKKLPVNGFVNNTIRLLAGRGKGQTRNVVANADDTLMVSPNWVINPDSTTIFDVRNPDVEEVFGEPSSLYDRYTTRNLERRGSLYSLSYQIQIIGPNPELTIYLTSIVKSIFTINRIELEKQGVINMKLGATDFIPQREGEPDFIYTRAINVDFIYPFDIFETFGSLAESLKIDLESCPKGIEDASSTTVIFETEPNIELDRVLFVNSNSSTNNNDGSPIVINTPSNVRIGDFMIAVRMRFQLSTNLQAPPLGWSVTTPEFVNFPVGSITDNLLIQIFQRFVQPNEPSSSSWIMEEGGILCIVAYRNVDTQDPIIDKSSFTLTNLQSDTVVVTPSIKGIQGGMLVASFATNQSGSISPDPFTVVNMNQREERLFSTTTALGIFDELLTKTSRTDVRSATIPISGGQVVSQILSLRAKQTVKPIIK